MTMERPSGEIRHLGRAARGGVGAVFALVAACQPVHHPAPVGDAAVISDGARRSAGSGGCQEVITPASARRIFEQVTALRASDGCAMSDVSTQLSVMRLSWTRQGAAIPDVVLITPAACAPRSTTPTGRYVFQQSEAFAARCPATFAALTITFAQRVPPPTRAGDQPRRARGRWWLYTALAAAALGAFAALRWRRARARQG